MARRGKSSIDIEVMVIKAQLEVLERRELEFQKLIHDMERLKSSISEEKGLLKAKARELEAERFPVNWLPTELLADIFVNLIVAESVGPDDEEDYTDARTRHPTPIILSHVCQRWRNITFSTPQLWSCLSYRGASWNEQARHSFLERSRGTPLDVIYWGSTDVSVFGENQRITSLFDDLSKELGRLRSITLECHGPDAVLKVVNLLTDPLNSFPQLRSLNISIIQHNPSFTTTRSLLRNNALRNIAEGPDQPEPPTWSNLTHLKLRELPLFNLPSHFLANLTSLTLSYPSAKTIAGRYGYQLLLTSLCRFLSFTPRLEELSLCNAVPRLDAILHDDAASPFDPENPKRRRVELHHLKRLDWSYPCPGDVHHVMTFFDTPVLEKLDLWVEEAQTKRVAEVEHTNWYQASFASLASTIRSGHELPSLRQLSLQCAGEESISSVVRKFKFPVLEKLEIINSDTRARVGNAPLPTLPGLESIFRDPRLPHLTHLTLSHLDIPLEQGKPEAMLGYLPVLVSLSLDTCAGVGEIMKRLQERHIGAERLPTGEFQNKHGVRFCPRLEALSFWGCEDIDIDGMRAVVRTRNRRLGRDPHGDLSTASRGVDVSATGGLQGNAKQEEITVQRRIRPLRKSRRQDVDPGSKLASSSAVLAPSANILTSMIAMEEAFRPASIVYLRIEDCPSITHEEALSLKDFDVVDVIYNGSDSAG